MHPLDKTRCAFHVLLLFCRLVKIAVAEFDIKQCLVDFAGAPRHREEAFPTMVVIHHWVWGWKKVYVDQHPKEIPPDLV